MAYGNIYYAGWSTFSKQGYVYIDKMDYAGAATPLQLTSNGFYISTNTSDSVIGLNAEFEIMNDPDFFDLLPLLTNREREYKVRIVTTYPTSVILFEGFLNCDIITLKYLHYQPIKFVASSYLSKLENVHPVSVDTLQDMTFINLFNEILRSTGAEYDIYVNSTIKAEGDVMSATQTLFNKNGVFTELFWLDTIERITSINIIKTILLTFNCYLYFYNGKWYIEREDEVWKTSIDFVKYVTGVEYEPNNVGIAVNETRTIVDLHTLLFTETSQTISINPGLKTIKINLQDSAYISLSSMDLTDIVETTSDTPIPPLRTWMARRTHADFTDVNWTNAGEPYNKIKNSIKRNLEYQFALTKEKGLTTSFKFTVGSENTQLNISCKYAVPKADLDLIGDLEFLQFTFYWYLRILPNMEFILGPIQDPYSTIVSDVWSLQPMSSNEYALQAITEVPGSSFNQTDKSVELSIDIPMGLVEKYLNNTPQGKLTGDVTCVFGMGTETVQYKDEGEEGELKTLNNVYYGDFIITESGENQPNVIEGTMAENFLNKKEISLNLYDAESYSYKNAILRGDVLDVRTERWGTLTGDNEVRERGVCYGLSASPTVAGDHVVSGSGFGTFTAIISGLTEGTLYYARAYAINGNGTVIYGADVTFTTLEIVVGHFYEGGIVGYLFQPGDEGYVAGQKHGLIVSKNNLSLAYAIGRITGGGPYTSDANILDIGGGDENTAGLIANPVQSLFAISLIVAYNAANTGGYNDWFLPSYYELGALFPNRKLIGDFISWYYWSSSEPADGALGLFSSEWKYAHAINFGGNGVPVPTNPQGYWKKTHLFAVRAVRTF